MLVICLVNVSVAMTIGLAIMNIWQPGLAWLGRVDELLHLVPGTKPSAAAMANVQAGSQSPIEYLASYIPRTLADPFSSNNIIGVVLLALVLGLSGCQRMGMANIKPAKLEAVKDCAILYVAAIGGSAAAAGSAGESS